MAEEVYMCISKGKYLHMKQADMFAYTHTSRINK